MMVSIALIMGTIGTALASPLYPIYQEYWQLVTSQITFIFVAYMFGCLGTLLFLGRTSNSIGFLRTLQIGLVIICLGLVISIFATDVISLSIGRFFIGIASGLMTTSAMLGLIQTIPATHKHLAPQLVSIITAIGFGLGPFIGGVIAQFSEAPLVTPYLPIFVGAVLCFFTLFYLRVPTFSPQPFSIAPKLLRPARQFHSQFYIIGLTAFSAFAAFSLFASLSPSFVQEILPWHGPLISGSAITLILLISATVQFIAKNLASDLCLNTGLVIMCLSLITLGLCMQLKVSWLFFLSDILFGIGHGFALMGAFGLIHAMTTLDNRAAVMATYLFMGYLGTILPILAVGYLADHFGLTFAILVFCAAIAILCFGLWLSHRKINMMTDA